MHNLAQVDELLLSVETAVGGRHGRAAEGAGWQGNSLASVQHFRGRHRLPGAPADVQWRTVHRTPPALARRSTKSEIFETGIKVIDVLVRLGRGGKAGLFGGAGVLPNMVMAFGQMNEPPGSRFRVDHVALTMAEYFRLRSAEHRGEMMRLGIAAATHRTGGSVLHR